MRRAGWAHQPTGLAGGPGSPRIGGSPPRAPSARGRASAAPPPTPRRGGNKMAPIQGHNPQRPGAARDWRGQSLVLKLTNSAGGRCEFNVRVDDDPGADGKKHTRAGSGTLQARETATYSLSMAPARGRPGSMRGLPPVEPGVLSLR